ncbi:hypothetical protein HMPREF9071_0650 [Capnocytophaga sp. oral taxon 338 str. F0234]|nr:hypothetical protein HMPREF9071_0650 [Capnocytophaga sp. oral taxon 338 str. F0234]
MIEQCIIDKNSKVRNEAVRKGSLIFFTNEITPFTLYDTANDSP